MRISEKLRYDTVQQRVETSKAQNMRQMDRLAAQKDILALSDDPVGAVQAIRQRNNIGNLQQYQKNIEFSKGFIESTAQALDGIANNLIRAKELAVGMANDTYDKASRSATAREIRELLEEIVQHGNAAFSGRYVFGGFRNQTPPVSLDGDYVGDDGVLFLQISRGAFRQINIQARNLFEATPDEAASGHFNMVHTVEMLYDGLRENNKDSINKALGELDFQLDKTTSYHASLGAQEKALHDTMKRINNEEFEERAALSRTEDTDIYDATSEFKRTEAVLQGTLLASTKLLQPSLLNFLQ